MHISNGRQDEVLIYEQLTVLGGEMKQKTLPNKNINKRTQNLCCPLDSSEDVFRC